MKRREKKEKIQKILEELKGTKNIPNIKSMKKRILIPKSKNMKGETITSRKGIADVFGEFYAKLYDGCEETGTKEEDELDTEETKAKCDLHMKKSAPIPEFTTEERQDAIVSIVERPVAAVESKRTTKKRL